MLELIIASTMTVTIMTSIGVVMRTARSAWEAHEADFTAIETGHATLRHIVRRARSAQEVVSVSAANSNSATLTLEDQDGNQLTWDHDSVSDQVDFGENGATDLLAMGIDSFNVIGYEADGVTATTAVDEIRSLQLTVQVTLGGANAPQRTISSRVWIRTW